MNKGLVPLGSVCSEDDDVDENYVPMSAAATEPPVAPRSEGADAEAATTRLPSSLNDTSFLP